MLNVDPTIFIQELIQGIGRVTTIQELNELKVKYLGRKGLLAQLASVIPNLSDADKPAAGRMLNELKSKSSALLEEKAGDLNSALNQGRRKQTVDIQMPSVRQDPGRMHPVTGIIKEICGVFERLGFEVVYGPEAESEKYNFTALNIPLEHPSRDAFDTFYLKENKGKERPKGQKLLLRSHTSPVQARIMESRKPPIAVVVPGKVYRPDAVDASHLFMFHQIEGLMVDKNIHFTHLKGVLECFVKAVFSKNARMRFRPHFFPFTEPSAEVDISCIICGGKGCSVCGRKGWLEILGSGMVHPRVLKQAGIDSSKYTGFAFGLGIERIAMLKYGIDDIRLFFENDLRFIRQF